MNEQEARDAVHRAIGEVAPDVEPAELAGGARLRQDLELDSLDFLRLIETVAQLTGVEVPDSDAGTVLTVGELVSYVAEHG